MRNAAAGNNPTIADTRSNQSSQRTASRRSRSIKALRRYPVLSVLLAMMILSFIAGVATGFDLVVRLNYILLILILVSWAWSAFGAAQLSAAVTRPKGPFSVGDILKEHITIRNSGRTPKAWVEIEDKTDIPQISLRDIASLGIVVPFKSIHMEGTLAQRGEYQLGPLVIRTADPFGLFPREIQFAGSEKILVYPKIEQIPNFAASQIHMVGDSPRRHRMNVLSTDVSSVREYSDGDPIGRIHWLTTARTGDLMVKQFDQGSAGEIWVLFDQHREAHVGDGKDSTDEYAATIAASTINRYAGSFVPIGYIAHGSQTLISPPEHSSAHRDRIMRHIAASKPIGNIPLIDALSEIERELYVSSTLVVITAAPDGPWTAALGSLHKRGVQVICIVLDRESFGAESSQNIYASLAAEGVTTYRVRLGDSIPEALTDSLEADRILAQAARASAPPTSDPHDPTDQPETPPETTTQDAHTLYAPKTEKSTA